MKTWIISLGLVFLLAEAALAQPEFLGEDLTSNRFNGLPNDTLQVVVFYDGAPGEARLDIQVINPRTHRTRFISIGDLKKFDEKVETREYRMHGAIPTGLFRVRGVVPDGVIDGLAFGLFFKDVRGRYHVLQSSQVPGPRGAEFVCGWPLGMNDAALLARTSQITNVFGREQARMAICGAKLLGNGRYRIVSIGVRVDGDDGPDRD